MSKALKRPGGEAAWPEPSEEFVHQLSDEITELRRPAPTGGRFRFSFALVAAVALLLPLAAFAEQAGDNLARRDDAVDVELVATDDDDGGGGGGDDSETSVAGAYDVGGDSESESSGHIGEYDDGGGEDSESSEGGAAPAPAADAGGDDSDSDSGSDDGAAADQPALPALPATPAPTTPAPGGGDDDSDSGGEDT